MSLEDDTTTGTQAPAGKTKQKASLEHIKIHITAFTASLEVKPARMSHQQLAALWPNGSSCGRLPTERNLTATRWEAQRGVWYYCMWANTARHNRALKLNEARQASWTNPDMKVKTQPASCPCCMQGRFAKHSRRNVSPVKKSEEFLKASAKQNY